MSFLKIFIVNLLALTAIAVTNTHAGQVNLIKQMMSGVNILMIRHAYAPGSGDPDNFKVGDCKTQRNLDDRGREQARSIGDWLRSKGIKAAKVYSSQWCRCLETAALMNVGPVRELPALNSFYERPQDRASNLSALRAFLARPPADGDLIILVTHHVTIAGITGVAVSSGEGVLLKLADGGQLTFVRRQNFVF
jgi:phosphohistidine phosphatase SixA